jgi:tetratricopeptide (TPR) repeat protein
MTPSPVPGANQVRRRRLGPIAVAAALLAGCAAAPPPAPPATPPDAAAAALAASASARAAALARFEQRQRTLAETAAAQGRWVEAIDAWDVVLALHAGDGDATARRARAEAAAQAAAAERLARARLAQQRGDAETATRLWLEVLALAPMQAEAADALRAIERERAQRNAVTLAARTRQAPRPASPDPSATAAARNALEHASLLAGQGEVASAIALLEPLVDTRQAQPALRAMLADLYLRQAEQWAGSDRAAAIALLERCLALRPDAGQASQARLRLRQIRALSAPSSSAR